MVAKSKEDFKSAERFWSGKPSLDAVELIVAKMKEREAMEEIIREPKDARIGVRCVGRMMGK